MARLGRAQPIRPYIGRSQVNQYARPDADDDAASWTTAPLFSKVDEVTPDAADEITSETLGISGTTSIAKLSLSTLTDPFVGVNHILRIQAKATFTLGTAATLKMELREAGTLRATLTTPTLTTGYLTYEYALSTAEADAITDYSALAVWLTGTFGVGNLGGVQVSWLEFDVPPRAPVIYTLTADGAITPTGVLVKQANTNYAGSVSPVGTLARVTAKPFAGSVTPAGTITKAASKVPSGAITPSGDPDFTGMRAFSGQIVPVGTLVKLVSKLLAGALPSSGGLSKQANVRFVAGLTPSGDPDLSVARALGGSITPTGTLTRSPAKALSGSLAPTGSMSRLIYKGLSGNITPSGALAKLISKAFAGQITPSGSMTRGFAKAFSGAIGLAGTLVNVVVAGVVNMPGKVKASISRFRTTSGISRSRTEAWVERPHTDTPGPPE